MRSSLLFFMMVARPITRRLTMLSLAGRPCIVSDTPDIVTKFAHAVASTHVSSDGVGTRPYRAFTLDIDIVYSQSLSTCRTVLPPCGLDTGCLAIPSHSTHCTSILYCSRVRRAAGSTECAERLDWSDLSGRNIHPSEERSDASDVIGRIRGQGAGGEQGVWLLLY